MSSAYLSLKSAEIYMNKDYFATRRPLHPFVGTLSDFTDQAPSVQEEFLQKLLAEIDLEYCALADQYPIPATEDREGYYGERHLEYWLSGLYDYKTITSYIPELSAQATIVDFGGASARVARHFLCNIPGINVILADLNINHIDFIAKAFPIAKFKGIKVSSLPYLPLPQDSVDLLYAFSVFTHIDAYELAWIAEINRIVKENGYVFLTIHNENTWKILPTTHVFQTLANHGEFNSIFQPGAEMPAERLVFDYYEDTIDYNCNVFHHSKYIYREWGKWFEVVKIISGAHAYQAGVLLRKRTESSS
jgi:SAM-dependent methyltransferase